MKQLSAEATAFLTTHELEVIMEQRASENRGYMQGWERPSDSAIQQTFSATDKISRAGRAEPTHGVV